MKEQEPKIYYAVGRETLLRLLRWQTVEIKGSNVVLIAASDFPVGVEI